jgi:hypothetical protein
MARRYRLIGLAAGLGVTIVIASGCLEREVSDTIVLEPDGTVSWLAVERDVRAVGGDTTADASASRRAEDAAYVKKALDGNHETAKAFRVLGATSIETRVVRDAWPYMVVSEARFGDFAAIWQNLLDRMRVPGQSVLEHDGALTRWTLTADTEAEQAGSADEDDALSSSLLEGAVRVMIRDGRFVEAVGFDLSSDDRVATLLEDEADQKELKLVLAWIRER